MVDCVDVGCRGSCVVVTPAGRSSRDVSRRSHSAFSTPLICEQFGRLFDIPAPRDAGGTVSCVARRARLRR